MMEPLILIPGLMMDARAVMPQLLALATDRPVMVALPLGADTMEAIAARMIDALPAHFAVAGFGLGGHVAAELLRRAPERITRLALVATDPLPETPAEAARREARLVAAQVGRLPECIVEEVPPQALFDGPGRDAALTLLQAMAEDMGVRAYIDQTRALIRRRDPLRTLRSVRIPVLILGGVADPLVPARRRDFLASMLPFAQALSIADAGHLPALEAPGAVNAALADFLAGPLLLR
jgi:pimeloyl-ACP methyl ester carboxylesterase